MSEPETFEQAWRRDHPRPYWNDPAHWEACRPIYDDDTESENEESDELPTT